MDDIGFVETVTVSSFDGQVVFGADKMALYEVGNFLGGGAAGTVYECENFKTREHYALKILNPLGYKIMSPALLRKCNILTKGKVYSESTEKAKEDVKREHLWWLVNTTTKQCVATYYSEKLGSLRELSLNQCMRIWGSNPPGILDNPDGGDTVSTMEVVQTTIGGPKIYVPTIQPKYAEFLRKRARIFREIHNMRKISDHENVIRLESVLELHQETKCTIFLVMVSELVEISTESDDRFGIVVLKYQFFSGELVCFLTSEHRRSWLTAANCSTG
jgi:serine/threonine protein kinase